MDYFDHFEVYIMTETRSTGFNRSFMHKKIFYHMPLLVTVFSLPITVSTFNKVEHKVARGSHIQKITLYTLHPAKPLRSNDFPTAVASLHKAFKKYSYQKK